MTFDEKLKSIVTNTDIPDDLSPEQIQRILTSEGIKPISGHRKLHFFARFAAVAAVIALIFTVFSSSMYDGRIDMFDKYSKVYEAFYGNIHEDQKYVLKEEGIRSLGLDQSANYVEDSAGSPKSKAYEKTESNAAAYIDTNEQVQGVHESDIVKTDGNYIYRLSYKHNAVYIIQAAGKELTVQKKISFNRKTVIREMYADQGQLIIISESQPRESWKYESSPYRSQGLYNTPPYTTVQNYHITDPASPDLYWSFQQDGTYETSRLMGANLYLLTNKTNFPLPENQKKYWKYIPYYKQNDDNKVLIDPSDIHVENKNSQRQYSVLSGHVITDQKSLQSIQAFAGYGSNYYVSDKRFYIASEDMSTDNKTKITSLSLDNGRIALKASGDVRGTVRNQFSMDEYNGYFRVATTSYYGQSNNLFILDRNMKVKGSITGIAKDEEIKSVRFDNEKAYLVTFKLADPLFTIDCSDPANPKILGKLKIPGYSTYMHNIDENTILGFGDTANEETGVSTGIKLSIFDVTSQQDPKELDKYEIKERSKGSFMSAEEYSHKNLLIDNENKRVGFEIYNYRTQKSTYYLFSYANNKLEKLYAIDLGTDNSYGYNDQPLARGTVIENYLYISNDIKLIAVNLMNMEAENTLKLE